MPVDGTDRRVQKTRKLLQDAMITLISEKEFDSITIQEILDRANVGRSTFYIHYDGKNDLLHSCFADFEKLFEQCNAGNGAGQSADARLSGFILGVFRFVGQNHRLFAAFLRQGGIACDNSIHINFQAFIYDALKTMPQCAKLGALRSEMLSHCLAYALVGILVWWLNEGMPCTAEEAARNFRQIATVDLRDVLR